MTYRRPQMADLQLTDEELRLLVLVGLGHVFVDMETGAWLRTSNGKSVVKHSARLQIHGYIDFKDDVAVLTDKGKQALA